MEMKVKKGVGAGGDREGGGCNVSGNVGCNTSNCAYVVVSAFMFV